MRHFQESWSKVEVFAFCQFFSKPPQLWQGKYLPSIGLQAAEGKNSFSKHKEGEHDPPAALGISSSAAAAITDLYISPGLQGQKVTQVELQEDPECSGIPRMWEKIGSAGLRIPQAGCGGWNGNCWAGNSPKTSTEWFNPNSQLADHREAQKSSDLSLNFRISDLKRPWGAGLNFPLFKGRTGTVWDQFGEFQHP